MNNLSQSVAVRLLLAVAVVGCQRGNEGDLPETATAALESRYEDVDLNGHTITPFTAAYNDRALFWARTALNTDALTQCINNSGGYFYMNLGDPHSGSSVATQLAYAEEAVRTLDNTVSFSQGIAENANLHDPPTTALVGINLGYNSRATSSDWVNCGADVCLPTWTTGSGTVRRYQPWDWIASGVAHEFSHTADYTHVDNHCRPYGATECAKTECAWTSSCTHGATLTPPSTLNWASCRTPDVEADGITLKVRGCQEWAAYTNGRSDQCYYRTSSGACCASGGGGAGCGDPSFPYILSECMGALIKQSDAQCADGSGHGVQHNTSCSAYQMRYLSGWTGTYLDAQTSTTCDCVADPRHIIALGTYSSGCELSATNGGGTSISTTHTVGIGAWELFAAAEYGTRSGWYSGDLAELKSIDGHFVNWGSGYHADGSGVYYTYVINAAGGGYPITTGSAVYLEYASYWAYDTGSALSNNYSISTPSGNQYKFWVTEPSISLVYLASVSTGNYVNTNADGKIYDTATTSQLNYATYNNYQAEGSYLSQSSIDAQAVAAFWAIDWNGGDLTHGDVISLRAYNSDLYYFVTAASTGQATLGDTADIGTANFTIRKVSGTGQIADGTAISLQSQYNSKYLTAVSTQIQNSGTSVGSAQEFYITRVQNFDYNRSAAW